MPTTETVTPYEASRNDSHGPSPWQRVSSVWKEVVEVWRESRALEARLLGKGHYRRIGYD